MRLGDLRRALKAFDGDHDVVIVGPHLVLGDQLSLVASLNVTTGQLVWGEHVSPDNDIGPCVDDTDESDRGLSL